MTDPVDTDRPEALQAEEDGAEESSLEGDRSQPVSDEEVVTDEGRSADAPTEEEPDTEDTEDAGESGSSADEDAEAGPETDKDQTPGGDAREAMDFPLENVVEALLVAATEPRTAKELAKAAGRKVKPHEVDAAIENLNSIYAESGRAFEITKTSDRYQMVTLPEYAVFLRPVVKKETDEARKLSAAALDTLAVIAYRQPAMRVDIEAVRGVGCGPMLRQLIEEGLVEVVGRNTEVVGSPMLYGTTEHFLEVFGLPSLEDLPGVDELRR